MRAWRSLVIAFVVGSAPLSAQSVTLAIKPRVGDTLRMRLDQESEMTGVRKTAAGEMSAMVLTTMRMFSRAIVEGATENGTAALAVTEAARPSTPNDASQAGAA